MGKSTIQEAPAGLKLGRGNQEEQTMSDIEKNEINPRVEELRAKLLEACKGYTVEEIGIVSCELFHRVQASAIYQGERTDEAEG